MKNIDFKKVIAWLGVVLRCQICQFKYNFERIQVIETIYDEQTNDARVMIHADCEKCKSSVMCNIDITGPDIVSVGMITDLTSKDTIKFRKYNPINTDDIINIHKTLKKFDGNLVKAIGKI
ncbi:MAG: hypothetical protein IT410_02870 [Candidatus Doudnabacteria bacterium]|nr:hypothetical protein [Candidatus Doudnabacteria bacterium]